MQILRSVFFFLTFIELFFCYSEVQSQSCNPHCYVYPTGNPEWGSVSATYRVNDNMGIPGIGQ